MVEGTVNDDITAQSISLAIEALSLTASLVTHWGLKVIV